jgi:serine phosphatase RsbU (regulator of sigma subunit)/Tfp pilus assembly protein PilF
MKFLLTCFLLLCVFTSNGQNIEYADSLQGALRQEVSDSNKAKTYIRLAEHYRYVDPVKNQEFALKAIELSRTPVYPYGLCLGFNLLAQSYENRGIFNEAALYYDSSLAVARTMTNRTEEARVLLNISNIYNTTADYGTAADYVMRSLELQEQLKDTFGIAICRFTLGNVQYGQEDYKSALVNYITALELNRNSNHNQMFEGSILANIGSILEEQNLYDSALTFFRSANQIFQRLKLNAKIASSTNNIGSCLFHLGQPDSALHYLHFSRAMHEELDRPDGLANSLLVLGNVHDSLENYDSAFYYYRSCVRVTQEHTLKEELLTTFNSMAKCFTKTHQYDSAVIYFKKYIDLNDLIHGEEERYKLQQFEQNYSIRKMEEARKLSEAQAQLEQEELQNKVSILAGGIAVLILLSLLLFNRYKSKKHIAEILSHKNKEITHQKDEITDSINYARRIQDSILAPMHAVKDVIPESFILYMPKDVVSGDFYWVEEEGGYRIFSAVDCTGHGVPGALMSVVGFNLLNRAVKELHLTKPSDILRELDYGVNKLLRQSESGNTVKDGMDISLCSYLPEKRILQYAGAFNPLYMVRDGQLSQVKADKSPIGVNIDGIVDNYTNHEFSMLPGDMVYLFSDGYADQFGGPLGKKYKYNQLRETLVRISGLPVNQQEDALRNEFAKWRGSLEQVDDVLIIGMRVR